MRLAAALSLFLFLLAPFAQAESSAADHAQFQEIITRQILAFEANDGVTAFGFASPDLQAKFGTPAIFMEMVRSGYAPVYQPRSVEFRAVVERDTGPEQQVFIIGPDGRSYIAHYMMERQPDGSWRISGCYLEPAQDESV
ncbi:MAG: DUF4864 domain-containing protein [Proteobacteria bacterium]|nr:DUF4864 domain-containing protein [Pseudomonadota bacterium]